jgi:hypothetical protein
MCKRLQIECRVLGHRVMNKFLNLGALVLAGCLLTTPAVAQQCTGGAQYPIAVQAHCTVELMAANGLTKIIEGWGKKAPLAVSATSALVTFGNYRVSADLVCSGKDSNTMAYGLEVRFTNKERPYASPIHLASLRNLMLLSRRNAPPILLESYAFFEPFLKLNDTTFSRIDYRCELNVSDL